MGHKHFTINERNQLDVLLKTEKTGIDFYFSDSYCCSWQRNCNENSNGFLREFYPKKTGISNIETEKPVRTLMLINSRPRKRLNYTAPLEKFLNEIGFKKLVKYCNLYNQKS